MSAAFTPGPWVTNGSHIHAPDLAIIATVSNAGSMELNYPLIANRDLIAAAPWLYDAAEDSLEAFKLLIAGLSHDRNIVEMIKPHIVEIETALAKARGQ